MIFFAYLDPGSGSYFFQILIAGLLGFAFMAKNFWLRLFGSLKNLFSGKEKKSSEIER